MLFITKIKVENPYLLVIRYGETASEAPIEQIVAEHARKHTIKSKSILPGSHEITYEVRIKQNDMNFVNILSGIEGVESTIMLSYDGNFTA